MSSITCPRCGSPVPLRRFFNLAGKPFCTRCGWNLDRAEAALAAKATVMRLLPLGIAAVGLFAMFTATRVSTPVIFVLPSLFALIALAPLWGYYSLRKEIAAAKSTVNPSLALAQPPLDQSFQMLQSLPRPRRIRFRFQGNSVAVVVAFGAFVILNGFLIIAISRRPFSTRGIGVGPLLPFLFVFVALAAVLVVPYFREQRNLPLLRDGELAFARVVGQQMVQQGKTSYSLIEYEFQTNTGQLIRNSVRDLTRAVFEDMTVPVFYDPLDPVKNITPCATYFRVVENPF